MEKFCPKCGYKSDFKFCPNCGFNLSNIRLPGEQPSQPKESDLKRLFVENYPAYKQGVAYREEHSAPEKLSMENSPEQTSNDQDTNQLLREILSSLEHQPPQAEYISPAQELGSLDQLSPQESSPTFSTVPQSQEDTPAYPVGYNVPVVQEQIIQQDLSDHPSDINASETAQGVKTRAFLTMSIRDKPLLVRKYHHTPTNTYTRLTNLFHIGQLLTVFQQNMQKKGDGFLHAMYRWTFSNSSVLPELLW